MPGLAVAPLVSCRECPIGDGQRTGDYRLARAKQVLQAKVQACSARCLSTVSSRSEYKFGVTHADFTVSHADWTVDHGPPHMAPTLPSHFGQRQAVYAPVARLTHCTARDVACARNVDSRFWIRRSVEDDRHDQRGAGQQPSPLCPGRIDPVALTSSTRFDARLVMLELPTFRTLACDSPTATGSRILVWWIRSRLTKHEPSRNLALRPRLASKLHQSCIAAALRLHRARKRRLENIASQTLVPNCSVKQPHFRCVHLCRFPAYLQQTWSALAARISLGCCNNGFDATLMDLALQQ